MTLERLACMVRASSSGTRPITGIDLAEVYRSETGSVAGEAVLMQLQRLPGLTPREQDPTLRSFVDPDMLSALQGGAIARAVIENSSSIADRRWLTGLTRDGVRMAAHILRANGFTPSTVLATATRFSRQAAVEMKQLVADCIAIVLGLTVGDKEIDCQGLVIEDAHPHAIDIEDILVSNLVVRDCIIDVVCIGPAIKESTISFEGCIIHNVSGVPSKDGLPPQMFKGCDFEVFDDASTNAAVLRLPIPDTLKVLMTVLRKLYLQAGGGRKRSALKRGLPDGHMLPIVDRVIDVLTSEGIVVVSNEVAHPVRKHTMRVQRILSAGQLADDPLVARVRDL